MKIGSNITTIAVIAIAVVAIYFITRTDIFQMQYYDNPHLNAGSQF